ncbi:cysteine--tRNA ligase [Pseudoduganella armeniaca]|uniref:Cysteine--tRNA ligase n=1 Tax=Pseudoduganella armeniaca TaxID=2072590 RepID=A0A2R4CHG3_9BURK|nr:cysteine--tRNA ligase [Pseudoduganella armeniaca]AVR98910.1 cysteine--tRNA ligase [Pseudoduganella armeniaca]
MTIELYDNWERRVRQFEPVHKEWVGLYCCGPTVYDFAHIGNLRTYLFEDILRRALELNGYTVRHVINITDVGHLLSDADDGEDKMERGSRRTGESAWAIAQRFTDAFKADMRALNMLEPAVWCKATDHIAEQIAFIQALEAKGYTYRTSDGIYFDTTKLDDYGYLARIDKAGLDAGRRVSLGEKRNVTDFALWKFSPAGETRQMEWDSPWGTGFPGWHIECSAMSAKYLEPWFDIHCGGEDHIAIHHTNEIAQNQACHGTRLANFWMHGHFLQLDAAKMSKSSGDFLRLQTLLDKGIDPLAYRYLCLTAHYRSPLNFTWEALQAAQSALMRLRTTYASWPAGGRPDQSFMERFRAEVNNDLNLPRALATVWELLKSDLAPAVKRASLDAVDSVLGFDLNRWQPAHLGEASIPDEVKALVEQRRQCRAAKDWKQSDALRAAIAELGYQVEDRADGMTVRRLAGQAVPADA